MRVEIPTSTTTSAIASTAFHPRGTGCERIIVSVRRNGATTRIPIASPAHQTDQAPQNSLASMASETSSVVAPTVALMMRGSQRGEEHDRERVTETVQLGAESHAQQQGGGRQRGERVPDRRHGGRHPRVVLIGRLTANAAIATPGHRRRPRRRNPTSAIPVGGQSGVMFSPTRASRRLSWAAR